MTMKTALLLLVALLTSPQGVGGGRYSKDGLAFDHPAEWKLADTSTPELQRVALTRAGASNLIMVFAQRELIKTAAQLYESRNSVTMPYVMNIAKRLGLSGPPPEQSQCVSVGGQNAVGFRLGGTLEGVPTTAEVYTIVLGQRLLHLVHVRADKDDAAGAAAWKALLDTLKVEGPAQASPEGEHIARIVSGGVLNGRAIKKPQPEYPSIAKSARASGVVTVQIVVDESGNVASARAVSGHPLLQPAGVEAARSAKFTPTTLCGKPVKVSGVITYGFVLN
ncbi:MAG TPA: energy transducer TonB [Pyrinomonadaceae bacterium]|nr:energy transducer TonB [Pyrinomonadaceae bacterium]